MIKPELRDSLGHDAIEQEVYLRGFSVVCGEVSFRLDFVTARLKTNDTWQAYRLVCFFPSQWLLYPVAL